MPKHRKKNAPVPSHILSEIHALWVCLAALLFRGFSLCVVLWGSALWAHTIDQLYLELTPSTEGVTGQFVVDAAYCLPEYRGDAQKQAPDRDWLISLKENDYERLRKESEVYLRSTFTLMVNEKPLSYELSFPDFLTDPPQFEQSLLNKALLRVNLKANYEDREGSLQVRWKEPFEAALIIYLPEQGAETDAPQKYLECGPDSAVDLGWEIGSSTAAHLTSPRTAPFSRVHLRWQNFGLFLRLGFTHILPKGLDHILFVVGLFLFLPRWQPLLQQTLLFTLAHSLTLAATIFGWIAFPSQWVEVFIAASIVYVGVENLWRKELRRSRLVLVFAFGLLHGMGFASMLESYLPGDSLFLPLLGFNIGVEIGQITVLALCFISYARLHKSFAWVQKVGSVGISLIAIYWVIERIS